MRAVDRNCDAERDSWPSERGEYSGCSGHSTGFEPSVGFNYNTGGCGKHTAGKYTAAEQRAESASSDSDDSLSDGNNEQRTAAGGIENLLFAELERGSRPRSTFSFAG